MQTFQTARLSCNQRKRKDHPVIVVDSPCPHLPSFHLQKTDVRSPATSENTKSGIYKAFQRHPFGLYVVSFSFYLSSYLHREVLSPGFNVCSKFFFFSALKRSHSFLSTKTIRRHRQSRHRPRVQSRGPRFKQTHITSLRVSPPELWKPDPAVFP